MTVSQTSLPGGNSLSLAVGYQAVWVTGIGVTYQVDEATGRIVRTIPTPGTFPDGCRSGIAAGAGAVWVTYGCRGVYRIDPPAGGSRPPCGYPASATPSRSPMAWCG